ncbi:hypothetical protein SARC_05416 [Sphaeroforma arctica JP610]|uniref:DNA polymerase beta thumb domain-containing protein n=1 Tax=Sphaeroforma arctica JP610 TaxID=667725 RepID=A0A0L0FZM4_9EUKA|nr:hypothetical protein SARC_05416 [Sphaeroforma arctica JP610]KNC82297.1 hypothetical protein SARC_05416 [Sphaeroforma arctica JP610]|eukprot:XP_014156199.1 hypothetical protein SARC_05416 [Sphaeroforma arctica JP610]
MCQNTNHCLPYHIPFKQPTNRQSKEHAEQEACSLLFYTGPAEHNYDIAKEAQEQGICLFPRESEVLPQCQFGTDMGIEGCTDGVISEAGIYELLNVDYVRPEDRF